MAMVSDFEFAGTNPMREISRISMVMMIVPIKSILKKDQFFGLVALPPGGPSVSALFSLLAASSFFGALLVF